MKEDIKKILELSLRAPSGDNCQPWKMEVEKNKIELYNDISKDTSLYNFKQVASYIALGALIENVIIASSNFGYSVDLKLFPDGFNSKKKHIATMELSIVEEEKHELFDSIELRKNNRKPYSIEKLSDEQKSKILQECYLPEVELKLVDDSDLINSIALAGSKNEKLVLENKKLHSFLFGNVLWTEKEAEERKTGMHVSALEMPKVAELFFKVCSNWNIMKFLTKVGLPNVVAKQNQQIYMKAGAYGAVILKKDDPLNIIQAGRIIQRVWLRATQLGLSFNAMAGITLLKYRTNEDTSGSLSEGAINLVNDSYKKIEESFSVTEGFIPFVFRLGKSKPARTKTYRLPVDTVTTFK